MKITISLFILIIPLLSFGQIDLQENNEKLFGQIESDTIYDFTQNYVKINLDEFSDSFSYSYRCSGGLMTLKLRDLLTISPCNEPCVVKVYLNEPPTLPGGTINQILIGQKKFITKSVPTPAFFVKVNDLYSKLNPKSDIENLTSPIFIFPSLLFKENYPSDSKYIIENFSVKVKRGNIIIYNKTIIKSIESIVLQDLLTNTQLLDGDVVELIIDKYYRINYLEQHIKNKSPLILSLKLKTK